MGASETQRRGGASDPWGGPGCIPLAQSTYYLTVRASGLTTASPALTLRWGLCDSLAAPGDPGDGGQGEGLGPRGRTRGGPGGGRRVGSLEWDISSDTTAGEQQDTGRIRDTGSGGALVRGQD